LWWLEKMPSLHSQKTDKLARGFKKRRSNLRFFEKIDKIYFAYFLVLKIKLVTFATLFRRNGKKLRN
jgi:hypothetical protein